MFSRILLSTAVLVFASASQAALTFDKNTTISDGIGGEFINHSEGTLGRDGSNISTGTFDKFSFNPDRGGTIDGSISREAIREGDVVDVSYDGDLTLSNIPVDGATTPREVKVVFTDLKVQRNEEGVSFAGTITVNGEAMEAYKAPRWVRGTIARLAGLFRL